MLTDARTVPAGEVITTDVCVVGAGPAGVTVSKELAAAGMGVVLLEKGDTYKAAPPDPGDTALSVGIPYPVEDTRASAFGGSIHKWRVATPQGEGFGRLRELDDEDFEARDWVPLSGWPFIKDILRPFYTRARALFDHEWPSEDPEAEFEAELERGPFEDARGIVRPRVFFFANPAVFAASYRRQLDRAENVLVLTNANVTEILTDESTSSVSSVNVASVPASSFAVTARCYILCGGGVEIPRLLLASRSRFANGLGNGHDLVGRFFMEHPHYASGILWPKDPRILADPEAYAVHIKGQQLIQRKFTLNEQLVRSEGMLRCAYLLEANTLTERIRRLAYGERTVDGLRAIGDIRRKVAADGRAAMTPSDIVRLTRATPHAARYALASVEARVGRRLNARRYTEPRLFRIQAMAEQAPNAASRVTLDEERDSFGVPRARLDWQLSELDKHTIRRTQELFAEALRSNGFRRITSLVDSRELPPALNGGSHHMGTTRMHDSPRSGVVDRNARVHGVDNLYVAGSSVFPTVGYANPTLTLLALSLRLADHLRDSTKPVEVRTTIQGV